jgi:Flp pilus assembly protein TadG
MKPILARLTTDIRGVAAIEFALIIPVLLMIFGAVVDFTLAFWTKGLLANSVAEGAQYAFLAGPSASASLIQGIVRQTLSLGATSVTVTGPTCYCIGGMPAAPTGAGCAQSCPDSTTAGTYMTISAQFTYQSILPFVNQLGNPNLLETATVRLQ